MEIEITKSESNNELPIDVNLVVEENSLTQEKPIQEPIEKEPIKNKGGRPLKFSSVEELSKKIEDYFISCDETVIKRIVNKQGDLIQEITKPYSITGLAYYLKTDRHTLINYGEREEFFHTIKDAKQRIEADYEERGLSGVNSAVMSIFTLKNNFVWKDKTETELSGKVEEVLDEKQIDELLLRRTKTNNTVGKE